MNIKHSDPKLSVEEAWLTMTIWRIYIYGCWQYHTPSANIDYFLIFRLHNNLYKCWITKSSSEDINHIHLLLMSRLLKFLYSLLISSKKTFLSISNFGHCNKKWHSSSISNLNNKICLLYFLYGSAPNKEDIHCVVFFDIRIFIWSDFFKRL